MEGQGGRGGPSGSAVASAGGGSASAQQPRTPNRRHVKRKGGKGAGHRQRPNRDSRTSGAPATSSTSSTGAGAAVPSSTTSSSSSSTTMSISSGASASNAATTSFSASTSPSVRLPPNSLFPLFVVGGRDEDKDSADRSAGGMDRPTKILVELDRGLRSTRTGDQCEAIHFFARLIATYPWPVIVGTAALKLADLFFRTSNNFVRYAVCETLRQCESVLTNHVLNVDEILRRIQSVLTSNDPVARAITLRTLCAMPSLVAERLDVHHAIRDCWSSKHELEREAVLWAMDRVSARSPNFAWGVLGRLADMVHGLSAAPRDKMKLVHMLRLMHHDPSMAQQARTICEELLKDYPGRSFTVTVLDALTSLALRSRFETTSHSAFLLRRLEEDPRLAVKLTCLRCLRKLALASGAHSQLPLKPLAQLAQGSPYNLIQRNALNLLSRISSLYTLKEFQDWQEVSSACEVLLHSKDSRVSALAAQILTNNACSQPSSTSVSPTSSSGLMVMLVARLAVWCLPGNRTSHDLHSGKMITMCLIRLLKWQPALADALATAIVPILPRVSEEMARYVGRCVLECARVSKESLHPHTRSLGDYLVHAVEAGAPLGNVFRAVLTSCGASEAQQILFPLIESLVSKKRNWDCFLSARAALSLGHPALAVPIFQDLAPKVESENLYWWLKALCLLSQAEAALSAQKTAAPLLDAIITAYYHALTAIQASGVGGSQEHSKRGKSFQQAFVQLRVEFLESMIRLQGCLRELPLSAFSRPSPQEIEAGSQHLVSKQLVQCSQLLRATALGYAHLARCHFDIDELSLATLQALQEAAQSAAWAAASLAKELYPRLSERLAPVHRTNSRTEIQNDFLRIVRRSSVNLTSTLSDTWEGWSSRLGDFLRDLMRLPCAYPPFFFQARPATEVKLAVSAMVGEGAAATGGKQGLVVKVTGLLTQPSTAKRKVHQVEIEVLVRSRTKEGGTEERKNGLSMRVEGNNSFLGAVVVELWGPALYSVSLTPTLTLIDDLHARWLHSAVTPRPVLLDVPQAARHS